MFSRCRELSQKEIVYFVSRGNLGFFFSVKEMFILSLKAIALQRAHFEIFHKCITPMASSRFINTVWPELAKLVATRRITIHKFHSSGMDCLNELFFHLFKRRCSFICY